MGRRGSKETGDNIEESENVLEKSDGIVLSNIAEDASEDDIK